MAKTLLLIVLCFNISIGDAKVPISGDRYYQLSGKESTDSPFSLWDHYYNKTTSYIYGKTPAKFLSENFQYIKGQKILDIGMGEGRNAVFLATKGHNVTGIDISKVAIKKAIALSDQFNVKINAEFSSIEEYRGPKEGFDAVLCFYFLHRPMNGKIQDLVKVGGILMIETYTEKESEKREFSFESFPRNFLVKEQELLTMFPQMKILKYEEPIHLGKYTASIILQKVK